MNNIAVGKWYPRAHDIGLQREAESLAENAKVCRRVRRTWPTPLLMMGTRLDVYCQSPA
ncbi:hypothetical protein PZA11_002040 [Diplocarpon coronariae]